MQVTRVGPRGHRMCQLISRSALHSYTALGTRYGCSGQAHSLHAALNGGC